MDMQTTDKKKALVAMSGGVDSSVTAKLLIGQGYDCTGINMRLFSDPRAEACGKSCCSMKDAQDAARVADALGMPFYIEYCTEEFRRFVMDKFVRAYLHGITPNPCIDCNRFLKFDLLLDKALSHGCDYIATGHYARILYDGESGRFTLHKALDPARDQSYVLYMLTQQQLGHILFPLGEMYKRDVRKLAEEDGFSNADKPDSQDICFVPDGHYSDFITSYTGKRLLPGDFVDEEGHVLGRHKGLARYTIGQRRGLGIASERPWYVKAFDMEKNEVILAREEALFHKTLTACEFQWLSIAKPSSSVRCLAKIRYRHTEQEAEVFVTGKDEVKVVFDEPQRAITRGQAVVLYDGTMVLGGGTITGCE